MEMPTPEGRHTWVRANKSTEMLSLWVHWDTWWCAMCYYTQTVKSVQRKDSSGEDFNSPDICWKSQLVNSRMSNRSLIHFANSFISQRRKFPGGTVDLYSFLANLELVGISSALSNFWVRHIILEFMIDWEEKDSHTYYNIFSRIPNNLEILDRRSLEQKCNHLLP